MTIRRQCKEKDPVTIMEMTLQVTSSSQAMYLVPHFPLLRLLEELGRSYGKQQGGEEYG